MSLRDWARAVVTIASIGCLPSPTQAALVELWAGEQRIRLDAWARRGGAGDPPWMESFEEWKKRRA